MGTLFVDNIKQQSSQGSGTITIGASGETVALASGVVQSNVLYPAFFATRTSSQTISDETNTIVQFNNTTFDTNSGFDTSTYKYTIPVAGKYSIYTAVYASSPSNTDGFERFQIQLLKNSDVKLAEAYFDQRNNPGYYNTLNITNIQNLSANDTIYVKTFIDVTNGGSDPELAGEASPSALTYFGAYRIGT